MLLQAILLKIMAGYDPNDRYSAKVPIPDYPRLLRKDLRGMRLGFPAFSAIEKSPSDLQAAFTQVLKVMEGLGAQVREVTLPRSLEAAAAAQGIIRICDAAAYHRQYLMTRADQYKAGEGTGPEVSQVRTTVEAGSLLTAAQYHRAQQVRKVFIREMLQLFDNLDVLLTPPVYARATQGVPYTLGVRAEFNVCGFPAISVPCGFSSGAPAGLPVGLQIAAKPFQDATMLAVAYAYESATDWHKKRPAI